MLSIRWKYWCPESLDCACSIYALVTVCVVGVYLIYSSDSIYILRNIQPNTANHSTATAPNIKYILSLTIII